jgi:hypothetical protein
MSVKTAVCERPGCNRPLPEGRRKYCSDACGRTASRIKCAAENGFLRHTTAVEHLELKERVCLSCRSSFLSDGPWNRICPRCKRRESH